MTRLFAVIALGTLLLVSPARAQVGNWLEGMWPTVPERLSMPQAQGGSAGNDWWETSWFDFCSWIPELCE
jgi:hypothetical protein